MVFELFQADVYEGVKGGDGQISRIGPLQQEVVTDSLPPKKKPGIFGKLKQKAGELEHKVEQKAKQVGKQINHSAKDLNHEAQKNHVGDKVKKAAVAAGSHGLLGPAGVVAAKAIEEADKHKAKPPTNNSHSDHNQKPGEKKKEKKPEPTHLDLTNPYDLIKKHIPKL